jgi:hypothetical protein
MQAQHEVQLCIHKSDVSALDVYQRILRYKNYLVAMTNMDLLPPRVDLPFLSDCVMFTNGFKANFNWLFFSGPYSPWKDYYTLKVNIVLFSSIIIHKRTCHFCTFNLCITGRVQRRGKLASINLANANNNTMAWTCKLDIQSNHIFVANSVQFCQLCTTS